MDDATTQRVTEALGRISPLPAHVAWQDLQQALLEAYGQNAVDSVGTALGQLSNANLDTRLVALLRWRAPTPAAPAHSPAPPYAGPTLAEQIDALAYRKEHAQFEALQRHDPY